MAKSWRLFWQVGDSCLYEVAVRGWAVQCVAVRCTARGGGEVQCGERWATQ